MRAIALVALAGALVTAAGAVAARSTDTSAQAALSDVEMVRVCEAASNFADQRALTPEAAARNAPDSVYLTFAPEADASQRTVQCVVQGQKVVWHVAEAESPAGLLPQVAAERPAQVMTFAIKGETVQIGA